MKKVALSALAAVVISGVASADALTLYSDPKTGQVFTTPGEGRVEMGDFVSAKEVDIQLRDLESKGSEYQDKMSKYVNVKSHAKTLEFSGTHYFGFTSNSYGANNIAGTDKASGFELRRNYLQAKAYFNDKDYFRVTMDTTKELESTTTNANMYVKYAYLWLDKVLPYTGVEIGIAHRPWIDYEEHNSWYFRSINKVMLEDKYSVVAKTITSGAVTASTSAPTDVLNSADLGVNFKSKTDYISSEIGLFNGEGYHADKKANNQQGSTNLSFEYRLTAHLLGNGNQVSKYNVDKDTYANISVAGLNSKNHKDDSVWVSGSTTADHDQYDRNAYWFHAVYNQPEFLIAAQYGVSKDERQDSASTKPNSKMKMWSVNGEVRPVKDWTVLARYDHVNTEYSDTTGSAGTAATYNYDNVNDANMYIYGLAYTYNKNVKFIASGKVVNSKDASSATTGFGTATTIGNMLDKHSYMLTTEVEW